MLSGHSVKLPGFVYFIRGNSEGLKSSTLENLKEKLNEQRIEFLKNLAQGHPEELHNAVLLLKVDANLLTRPIFKQLLQSLAQTSTVGLRLVFDQVNELTAKSNEIIGALQEGVAETTLHFPVTFHYLDETHHLKAFDEAARNEQFKNTDDPYIVFETAIVKKMQMSNLQRLNSSKIVMEEKQNNAYPLEYAEDKNPGEKIKLKELAYKLRQGQVLTQGDHDKFAHLIRKEVQYVSVEQVQQALQLAQAEEQEQKVSRQLMAEQALDYEISTDELIDAEKFRKPPYSEIIAELSADNEEEMAAAYAALEKEIFANLPQSIKFLTPEAARHIACHLPALTAIDPEHLPMLFRLKKTAKGEFVLAYDPCVEDEKADVFRPSAFYYHEISEPIYHRSLTEQEAKDGIQDEALFEIHCLETDGENQPRFTARRLNNLWLRFGSPGIKLFFSKLKETDSVDADFSRFLASHYLKYFRHFDQFLDQPGFFLCLDKIKNYDAQKLRCLKKFLEGTGSSRHDLTATLSAFDVFWQEIELLFQEKQASVERFLQAKWITPQAGNPVVYMPRLLTLLRNARNLDEQITCLEGISLDHNAAYYASRYEGYKLVSSEMGFNYSKLENDRFQFNPNSGVYREELENILERMSDHRFGRPANGTPRAYKFLSYILPYSEFEYYSNNRNFFDFPCKKHAFYALLDNDRLLYVDKVRNTHKIMDLSAELLTELKHLLAEREKQKAAKKADPGHGRTEWQSRSIFEENPEQKSWLEPVSQILERSGHKAEGLQRYWLIKDAAFSLHENQLERLTAENKAVPYSGEMRKPPYKIYYLSDSGILEKIGTAAKGTSRSIGTNLNRLLRTAGLQIAGVKVKELAQAFDCLANVCEQIEVKYPPAPDRLDELPIQGYRAFVFSGRELFYVLRHYSYGRKCIKISADDKTVRELKALLNPEGRSKPLSQYELEFILKTIKQDPDHLKGRDPFIYFSEAAGRRTCYGDRLALSLLFVCNERYSDQIKDPGSFAGFVQEAGHILSNSEIQYICNRFLNLFSLDIRLDVREAYSVFNLLGQMNSCEFESTFGHHSKKLYLKKFFDLLEISRHGTLRMLDNIANTFSCRFGLPYIVDSADLLFSSPAVACRYRHDLLVFSYLLNARGANGYCGQQQSHKNESNMHALFQVRGFLEASAQNPEKRSLDYAFRRMLSAKAGFNLNQVLGVFTQANELATDDLACVDLLLKENGFIFEQLSPPKFLSDRSEIRQALIGIILFYKECLNKRTAGGEESKEAESEYDAEAERQRLYRITIQELQSEFDEMMAARWHGFNAVLSVSENFLLNGMLASLKDVSIENEFVSALRGYLHTKDCQKIVRKVKILFSAEETGFDLQRLSVQVNQARALAKLWARLFSRENYREFHKSFTGLLNKAELTQWTFDEFYSYLSLLEKIPQRPLKEFSVDLFKAKKSFPAENDYRTILQIVFNLHSVGLPSDFLQKVVALAIQDIESSNLLEFCENLKSIYEVNSDDPLLLWLMRGAALDLRTLMTMVKLTTGIEDNRLGLQNLLTKLYSLDNSQLEWVTQALSPSSPLQRQEILDLLNKSYSLTPNDQQSDLKQFYLDLIARLQALDADQFEQLQKFYQNTRPMLPALAEALRNYNNVQPFSEFLAVFEKNPYGPRNLDRQFSSEQLERVINTSADSGNESLNSYAHRKQLMEAALFVSEAGRSLPIYNGKPARDLSSQEIKSFLQDIRSQKLSPLPPFLQMLYALALMREAMYRASGQFPYSTQIIALIEGLMKGPRLIENIVTGEGKSLVDFMKDALLYYLGSTRVHATTSSVDDAIRDISNYSPFFELIGIPYTKKPITAKSNFNEYLVDGINYSTFSQLSLFLAKAEVSGVKLGRDEDVIGLRINESDFSILDNHIVYRYALPLLNGLSGKNEWIYTALNEFVLLPEFVEQPDSSRQMDLIRCRSYLHQMARDQHKSAGIISQLTDEQLHTWIESAIVVNYFIFENYNYVLTVKPELKLIENYLRKTRVAKILEEDGRPSPDAHYGNGMQQLLYAKLNAESQREDFVLESESRTVLASNNKNFIDYHIKRQNPGIIWGSSGSVGSPMERQEQEENYGFQFSSIEPHLKQRKVLRPVKLFENENAQLSALMKELKVSQSLKRPGLIFCKDIETAKRFYGELREKFPSSVRMQRYTAADNEDGSATSSLTEVISHASLPGMITVTTIAMGRNTDVRYLLEIGMDVYQTFPDTERKTVQMAGRTGRQSSPGDVKYFYNREDLQGKSEKEFRQALENHNKGVRQFNQKFYDLLAYFKECIKNDFPERWVEDKTTRDFWIEFSAWLETEYRHQEDITNQIAFFLESAIRRYRDLSAKYFGRVQFSFQGLSVQEIVTALNKKYPPGEKYIVCTYPVKITDCIPPAVIACQFSVTVDPQQAEDMDAAEEAVRQQLTSLFLDLAAGKKVDMAGYVHRLLLSKISIQAVSAIHKECIAEFLRKEASQAGQRSFWAKWLGWESHLYKVTQNNNYLLFFKAVADYARQPVINLEALRASITGLLTEYQSYWFCSDDKIKACNHLITEVKAEADVSALVTALNKTRKTVMEVDIGTNSASFWHRVNRRNSRLQEIIDGALNLTVFAQQDPSHDAQIDGLCGLLRSALYNPEILDAFQQKKSLDEFRVAAQGFHYKDKLNAKVLEKSLLLCLENKLRDLPPVLRCRMG